MVTPIRNGTEDTKDTNSSSNETSNRTQPPDEQGAARHANNVDEENREKTSLQFETPKEQGAAAAGIPREHLEDLGQETRKRPDVPFFIEACIDDVSRQLNDSQPNSSITQAHNIYSFYAGQFEDFGEEQFRKHLYIALKRANHLSNEDVAIRHRGKANKMPAFFGSFKASLRREYGVEPLKGNVRTAPNASEESVPASLSEGSTDSRDAWSIATARSTASQEELRQEEPEAKADNQEQTLPPAPASGEQEHREQPAQEPEYLMTNDDSAGWTRSATADHWADRLREYKGKEVYDYIVRSTRFGRWGFVLFERECKMNAYEYTSTEAVQAVLLAGDEGDTSRP